MLSAVVATLMLSAFDPRWLEPLSDTDRTEAQTLIAALVQNPRGPFSGISWFCNDGSVQPPKLNGCADFGGGKMYGVLGRDAGRLAKKGLFVGTVLAALDVAELHAGRQYRGRALLIEKYLERALDGWVLHGAKAYRGFRQDEDEERAARNVLIALASVRDFPFRDRATLISMSRVLPYGRGAESLAVDIRARAAVIGDADKAFAALRFKIHASPEPSDIALVDAYAQSKAGDPLGTQALELAAAMRTYYDPGQRVQRMRDVKGWVADKTTKAAIQTFVDTPPADTQAMLVNGLAVMTVADKAMNGYTALPERNLLLAHTIGLVEAAWLGLTARLQQEPVTRALALERLGMLLQAAHYAGLLSAAEYASAQASLLGMSADTAAYARGAAALGRVLEWARARVLEGMGAPLLRYQAVEARAAGAVDDLLRSGVMLPLAALLDRLALDAERLRGGGHRLVGLTASTASLRGENSGVATGLLRVIEPGGDVHALQRQEIALLYELPPELPPVSGIVTVGAVGSLSHVALLARNLGIPLASIGGDVASELRKHAGKDVVVGVSQGRRVVLGTFAALSAAEQGTLRAEARKDTAAGSLTINAAVLDLTTTRVLRLDEVSESDAGVRLGPKAAELGRLRRLFPERVSDAAVIPFGAFLKHVDAAAAGEVSPWARLKEAYGRYTAARQSAPEQAETELLGAMDAFRTEILKRPFAPGFEAEVLEALRRLGDPNQIGVFVRSDTNVEDLKDFTGAGLNLTVSNRVGLKNVLQAIREVWASPFTERSLRWRQRLLSNPEHVYPSVLLHRTVPSEKSGVILTADLESAVPGAITVSVGEGVAAVVDGGVPETLVLLPDQSSKRLASSRSLTRKVVPKPPAQGVKVELSEHKDPLLSDAEVQEIRALAQEVLTRIPPKQPGLPWDIEFGLLRGKAYLMQIRPLKVSRIAATHPFLTALDSKPSQAAPPLALGDPLP